MIKEKGVELSLFLQTQLRETFPLLQGCLEQTLHGEKVYLGSYFRSLREFSLDGRGAWMRGQAPPHLHRGTSSDCMRNQAIKQSLLFMEWNGQVDSWVFFGCGVVFLWETWTTQKICRVTRVLRHQRKPLVSLGKENCQNTHRKIHRFIDTKDNQRWPPHIHISEQIGGSQWLLTWFPDTGLATIFTLPYMLKEKAP